MHVKPGTITRLVLHAAIILKLSVYGQDNRFAKLQEARYLAINTVFSHFMELFDDCVHSTMPNQNFLIDDLNTFVNYPSRTTVGLGPKYTSNRKFFANLISTTAFKEMLAKDERRLREHLVKKLRFCYEAVLDKNMLREMYDREVDQTKL